jgi:hypothetical protein
VGSLTVGTCYVVHAPVSNSWVTTVFSLTSERPRSHSCRLYAASDTFAWFIIFLGMLMALWCLIWQVRLLRFVERCLPLDIPKLTIQWSARVQNSSTRSALSSVFVFFSPCHCQYGSLRWRTTTSSFTHIFTFIVILPFLIWPSLHTLSSLPVVAKFVSFERNVYRYFNILLENMSTCQTLSGV